MTRAREHNLYRLRLLPLLAAAYLATTASQWQTRERRALEAAVKRERERKECGNG